MSLLDKICQALIKMIRKKAEHKKLWQNASTGSAFPAQTVPLDLNDYDYVKIRCRSSGVFRADILCPIGETTTLGVPSNTFDHRDVTVSKTGLQFKTGFYYSTYAGTTKSSDSTCTPEIIVGIKDSGGVLRNLLSFARGCCICCLAY